MTTIRKTATGLIVHDDAAPQLKRYRELPRKTSSGLIISGAASTVEPEKRLEPGVWTQRSKTTGSRVVSWRERVLADGVIERHFDQPSLDVR